MNKRIYHYVYRVEDFIFLHTDPNLVVELISRLEGGGFVKKDLATMLHIMGVESPVIIISKDNFRLKLSDCIGHIFYMEVYESIEHSDFNEPTLHVEFIMESGEARIFIKKYGSLVTAEWDR